MVRNMLGLDSTILIVDPNDVIRKFLVAQCRVLGLVAHGVTSANQATRMLTLASYDVVLVEQDLPEMNGQEFIRRAHEICSFPPRLYILMGHDDPSDQATDDPITTVFLQKPIHTQTLAEAIFTRLAIDLDALFRASPLKLTMATLSVASTIKIDSKNAEVGRHRASASNRPLRRSIADRKKRAPKKSRNTEVRPATRI